MPPPGFVDHVEMRGPKVPCCSSCVHAALFERWEVCLEYGAYVLIHSSCRAFQARVSMDPVVVDAIEIKIRFSEGLVDLREGSEHPEHVTVK